jgi:hypothetical protein
MPGFLDRWHPWPRSFIARFTNNQLVCIHEELVEHIFFNRNSRYYMDMDMYTTLQRITEYGLGLAIVWHRAMPDMMLTTPQLTIHAPPQPQVQLIQGAGYGQSSYAVPVLGAPASKEDVEMEKLGKENDKVDKELELERKKRELEERKADLAETKDRNHSALEERDMARFAARDAARLDRQNREARLKDEQIKKAQAYREAKDRSDRNEQDRLARLDRERSNQDEQDRYDRNEQARRDRNAREERADDIQHLEQRRHQHKIEAEHKQEDGRKNKYQHRIEEGRDNSRASPSVQPTPSNDEPSNEIGDLYWCLGFDYRTKPSVSQIKDAYHKLANRHHPDKNVKKSQKDKDHSATRMREITQAKDILCDPERKEAYDAERIIHEHEFQEWKARKQTISPYKASSHRDEGKRLPKKRDGGSGVGKKYLP